MSREMLETIAEVVDFMKANDVKRCSRTAPTVKVVGYVMLDKSAANNPFLRLDVFNMEAKVMRKDRPRG